MCLWEHSTIPRDQVLSILVMRSLLLGAFLLAIVADWNAIAGFDGNTPVDGGLLQDDLRLFVNRRAYTLQFRHSNRSSGRSCQIQLTFRADSNLNSRRVSEGTFRCC